MIKKRSIDHISHLSAMQISTSELTSNDQGNETETEPNFNFSEAE